MPKSQMNGGRRVDDQHEFWLVEMLFRAVEGSSLNANGHFMNDGEWMIFEEMNIKSMIWTLRALV